jgi:hypothetical protein
MPRHVPADGGTIGLADRRNVVDGSFGHNRDAIGELKNFIKVFRDQKHCGAAVALLHDLRTDFHHLGEVEPEARIGHDQHIDVAG